MQYCENVLTQFKNLTLNHCQLLHQTLTGSVKNDLRKPFSTSWYIQTCDLKSDTASSYAHKHFWIKWQIMVQFPFFIYRTDDLLFLNILLALFFSSALLLHYFCLCWRISLDWFCEACFKLNFINILHIIHTCIYILPLRIMKICGSVTLDCLTYYITVKMTHCANLQYRNKLQVQSELTVKVKRDWLTSWMNIWLLNSLCCGSLEPSVNYQISILYWWQQSFHPNSKLGFHQSLSFKVHVGSCCLIQSSL